MCGRKLADDRRGGGSKRLKDDGSREHDEGSARVLRSSDGREGRADVVEESSQDGRALIYVRGHEYILVSDSGEGI